ncbi:PREDICTED: transcription factor MYB98-like [Nelumbo nucifera]|uniref:Transcription factor MYB98-like n=2 Tax=Nelumbo nucifera TaxID=4432 RepID=A0A822ZJI2_NELNU|nr:PREDICTED: transcription factor MYB98-like [Nelumbo nucifera]DAD44833.1 TPA_asm: hypothetical protein HUJ06_003063 [Nelumbo nucifera]
MEFDKNYRDDIAFEPIFLSENCSKPHFGDGFSLENSSSNGYFEENHCFDQFHVDGSSSNMKFGFPSAYLYQLETLANGYSTVLDASESKPFINDCGMGTLGLLYSPQMTPVVDVMEQDTSHPPLNFHEIESSGFEFSDEISCITANNEFYRKVGLNKRGVSMRKTSKLRTRHNLVKGQWTTEEDRQLVELVKEYGMRKWSQIAQKLNGRIGKQCRERWHNHLRPNIKKDTWSEEEDRILIQVHAEIGNKWAEIAKRLPGRTENSIKNHWNATKRRQFSRRRCRSSKCSKSSASSLLQNYIMSLTAVSTKTDQLHIMLTNSNMLPVHTTLRSPTQVESTDSCSADHLVSDYDFGDTTDFSSGTKLFPERCSIESLLEEMPYASIVDEKSLKMDMPLDMSPLMDGEVIKREMDLVEMITQGNS